MAIHSAHYHALRELHSMGELPQDCRILEIGEANYYGDMPLTTIADDIERLCGDDGMSVLLQLNLFTGDNLDLFQIAKVIYRVLFGKCETVAVDLNGSGKAFRLDLNETLPALFPIWFDVVINHGTAEHIFDVANVFRIMHDHCKTGGLMIHESPFAGWIDHGFYAIQPTLFYDLAAANQYEIRYLAVTSLGHPLPVRVESREQLLEMAKFGTLPENAMLFVAMRKTNGEPFRVPMQGIYAQTLSDEAKQAWATMR